jgi:hypothetical protein
MLHTVLATFFMVKVRHNFFTKNVRASLWATWATRLFTLLSSQSLTRLLAEVAFQDFVSARLEVHLVRRVEQVGQVVVLLRARIGGI